MRSVKVPGGSMPRRRRYRPTIHDLLLERLIVVLCVLCVAAVVVTFALTAGSS